MKYLLFCCLAVFSCFSCKNTSSPNTAPTTAEPTGKGGSQDELDRVAINNVIHNFYKWYEANEKALVDINYIKGGKSSTLDHPKLDAYFALLSKSGYIGQAYIDSERAYLKNLEATAWKHENVEEETLTGLDYARLFCAQDWDIAFWKTAPITAQGLGTEKVTAMMTGEEGSVKREQKFELVKENGKWVIAKIVCD